MWKNISIQTRLFAAFSLFLAILSGMGVFSLIQLKEFNVLSAKFTEEWIPELEIVTDLKRSIHEHRLLAERRNQTRDFRQLLVVNERLQKASSDIETALKTYVETDKMNHGTAQIESFSSQWKQYEKSVGRVDELQNRGEIDHATQLFMQETLPLFHASVHIVEELLEITRNEGREATEAQEEMHVSFLWMTVAAFSFAAIGAGLIFGWIKRGISNPIHDVSDAMNQLSSGDDSVTIPSSNDRMDEIGKLLRAAERYRASLILSRQLTERLDAAISNMPLGLAMYDSRKKLIICNRRYAEMYQLPEELTREATPFFRILRDHVNRNLFPREEAGWFAKEVFSRVDQDEASTFTQELLDGRTINIMMQRMHSGGWVALHDDVTVKRKTEERVTHMARHDMLTDLPNRFHFREQTEEALKKLGEGEHLAVLCLDLDRFKTINDTLGHPVGDALLRIVANRLRDTLREEDIVGRLGGDEFVIVQTGGDQPVGATMLSERIINRLSEPYHIQGHQVIAGASIGISIAPLDGVNPDQLLKNADMALYRAKQESRGSYCFFEIEMDARMQARRRMELNLRNAIGLNEFTLHYQPQLNLRSNEITGFEALLRWKHADQNISPADFIPLAEEIGLIIPIGQWVLSRACTDAAQWPERYNISINLSPAQFKDLHLVETVQDALTQSGLSPDRLELEITETVLLSDTPIVLSALHKFHELGVRVSLDDFGTGYSSLSYLRSFPFDKIKIDRSFINDLGVDGNANAIIRAVTGLSASLGMETTAEGIETVDQLMRVRQEGCTEVQGFLIGKPKPASDIAGLIRTIETPEKEITDRPATLKQ